MLIGRRPDLDFTLVCRLVSRNHCEVRQEEAVWVTDLRSRNGTRLNGRRLTPHLGMPFRPGDELRVVDDLFRLVAVDPSWLWWNDGTVGKLAHVIRDERSFDRLPLLADALEDAGCTDEVILTHCRGRGKHDRGCWVLDLLLRER